MASKQLVGRDSLNTNPNVFNYPAMSDINITSHGADLYWAVCAIMGLSALGFLAHAHFVVAKKRGRGLQYIIFHYITAGICFVACIAYFTMASNLGYAAIPVEFQRSNPLVSGVYREIFYVRYIDWVITTPLLLLDVLLTAGLPWPTILFTILVDEIMIVTGLVGALVQSRYKWGYFVFAMLALFFVFWNVSFVGKKHAAHLKSSTNTNIGQKYMLAASWTMGLWFLYPIAWGLSEGGNVISPDSEAIFYSTLDILAKPGFGALLIWAHSGIEPSDIGIHIRNYDEPRRGHYLDHATVPDGPKGEENATYDGANDGSNSHPLRNRNGNNTGVFAQGNGHQGHTHPAGGPQPANGTTREAVSSGANPHGTTTTTV